MCNQRCQQGRFCTCAPQCEPSKTELILCAVCMFAAVFVPGALWIVGAV
jgi:hypothetical protein